MHVGLIISVFLHLAILVWTFLAFQSQRQLVAPTLEPVAVGMITPSEATKVRQGTPTAKQPETEAKESPKGEVAKKEAPKPRPPAAAPPPPPREPPAPKTEQKQDDLIAKKLAEAPPPPPPAPPPEEKKTPDAAQAEKPKADEQRAADALQQAEEARKVEEQKRAEERQRLEEQRRQAELKRKENEKKRREAAAKKKRDEAKKRLDAEATAKSKFDADRIAALLNKVPDKSAPPPSAPPNEPTKAKGPALGAPDGRDRQVSASEIAMIGQIIKSCMKANWTVLSGGASAQETAVKIRLRFKPDGTLRTPPEVVNPQGTPYFVAISESAIRAVQKCEPFDLPPAKYEIWRDLVLNFQPRDMF